MDGKAYVFNGDGDISEFITKVELYSALKEYDDEKRAQNLASRLEGPAFDVYLRLDQDDRKNINKLKDELLKEFESGRRNREEAVCTLTKRYRKQGESAHTYAYKIKELVNLAYPDFENAAKSTLAKDQFVRGLHADMQMALKCMDNFKDCDINALADHIVRLEIAGIKSNYRGCSSGSLDSVNAPRTSMQDSIVNSIVVKVVDKLANLTLHREAGGNATSERNRSPPSQQLKCWCCKSSKHLIRNCPNRFCKACGQQGHDSKDNICPKYQWLTICNSAVDTVSSSVVIAAKLHNLNTHVMLDTGSGTSVIDLGTLQKIGLDNRIDKSSAKSLINASGDRMKILGSVFIPVTIPGSRPQDQAFQVLDSVTYSNILLGRDFMRKFGTVRFDFKENRIELGKLSITGLSTSSYNVRLCESSIVPARSEKILLVKCSTFNSLLEGDFEPNIVPNVRGLYATRSRIIPNIDGVFPISVLNVTESDIHLHSRKIMGSINATNESVKELSRSNHEIVDMDNFTISDRLSPEESDRIKSLLTDYKEVFARNPKSPKRTQILEHRIITNDALPVYHKPRRVPVTWEQDIDTQVSEMLSNGIIRPSYSPWNAPVMLVKKKDNSTRFVCDFRGVNEVTKRDTYPLPHIKDVIDKMAGSKYWSTLDAASAYWSIPLSEADKEKTAFAVPRGKFEFNVMPFGLSNSGATYQRMMDICLSGLRTDKVLSYMDDIVIFSKTFDEHIRDLKSVFECLHTAGVTLKASKCIFAAEKVEFLGFELSVEGIKPQARLTNAINDLPRPGSKKELRRFLGMAGFYRAFIKDFAALSQPLNRLTGDNVPFVWDSRCDSAFQKIKQYLICKPVLAFPKLNEPFVVEVDASDYAAGGVLSQKGVDNVLHPIAYFSTSFTGSQRNWAPITKEAFALVLAVRHWHIYLIGAEFILRSDHNPLVYIRKQKDPRGKFGRWIAELEEYHYTVEYIPGKDNVKADCLSRNQAAHEQQPQSSFEDKIYATMMDNSDFVEQLKYEQGTDPLISATTRLIKNGESITEGRLKRVKYQLRIENDLLTKSGRPIVPASMRKFVVSKIHNTTHVGTDKTYAILKDRFFWPNMYGFVRNFISQCSICQQTKCHSRPPKAPLVPLAVPDAPMHFISLDIAFMPKDHHGFQYFLLIGDIFSKYIATVPLKDQTASTIVNALLSHWVYIHGTPYYILSDQGSNVDGDTIREICNVLGIEKRRSSAYHSQGNGFAERNIRSVKDILRSVILSRKLPQHKWRSLLPELTFALNTSESKATKCSPYYVVFGRSARLPIDVLFCDKEPSVGDSSTPLTYAQERQLILKDVFDVVFNNLQISKLKMQAQYNENLRFLNHQEGEKVWLKVKFYKTGENRKLAPRYSGPWTIVRKLPNGVNFEINNSRTSETKIVHHDRLLPFKSGTNEDKEEHEFDTVRNQTDNDVKKFGENHPPGAMTSNSSEDEESSASSDTTDDVVSDVEDSDSDYATPPRQYPQRMRRPRQFYGDIPWDAIRL